MIEELAALTESTSGSEVVNVALATLAWVMENKRRGKHVYASGALPTEVVDVDELNVDLPSDDD